MHFQGKRRGGNLPHSGMDGPGVLDMRRRREFF